MHVKNKSTNSDLCGNMETSVMFSLFSPSFYNQATSSIVRRFFTSHLKFLFPTVLVLFAITVFPFTRCLLFPILVLFAITPFLFTKYHNRTTETKNNNNIPKKFPLPPGPKPWPFLGSLPEMLKNKPAYRWILNLMAEMNTEIISICLGKVRVVVVTCPKIGREFLKTQDAIFSSRPLTMASQITSGGYLSTILVPFGPQWKKMKRIMTREVLSLARHHWLHQKRIEEADHLVHYVYNQFKDPKKCGLVNVRLAAQHYCGNVTRKMVFNKRFFGEGTKDGGPGFEEEEHVNAIFTILAYLFSFSISDYLPFLVDLDLDGHKKVVKKANEIIGKYHDPIIEERAKQWKDGTRIEVEDLLDVLITSKDENGNNLLSKEEIKATITEIMIAAVDNPSNAAEWALAEMINQPETLEKAIEELDRVVGKERLVQESDFSQLNYVKACAKEAFRLHPIAPFIPPHVSMADTTASGYSIPKGSHVLLSRKGIGRNPNVWDEPLKFQPERHLKNDGSEVVLTDHDLNLISFSTGRRGCPGIALGTSMTTMLFARLLQCFTWSPPPGESSIDLSESNDCLALAKPLLAIAKPRLATNIYQV